MKTLRDFPGPVRDESGYSLLEVQHGKSPENSKQLTGLAKGITGILEIVIDHDKETYRVVYVAKLVKGVYVLHVFHKKSKSGIGIPPRDTNLIVRRYKIACENEATEQRQP